MEMKPGTIALGLALAGLCLAGCATLERNEVTTREEWLAAAGFQARPADTPAKLSDLESKPPHKLVSQPEGDHFVYYYADPDVCDCMYVGGPKEYSAYQRLYVKREIEEEVAAEADDGLDWDVWGP